MTCHLKNRCHRLEISIDRTNALSLWFRFLMFVLVIVCQLHWNDIVAAVNVSVKGIEDFIHKQNSY